MCTFRSLMVVGLSVLSLAALQAQEKGQRRNPANPDQPGRREARTAAPEAKGAGQLDKYFVSCLKSDNKAEITIATLAAQKATNPEVKAFAQEMVKDHTDFIAKLDRFDQAAPAARRDGSTPDASNRDNDKARTDRGDNDKSKTDRADNDKARTERAATDPPKGRAEVRVDVDRAGVTAQTIGRGTGDIASQLMQVKQEITDRCVASLQSALNEKEGKEFDHCYIGMQVGAHMHMVATLSVLNTHASPELQQVIDEGLQTAQQHLEHAKKIAKQLEGAATASDESAKPAAKTARKGTDN